jgi:hypothetical protein
MLLSVWKNYTFFAKLNLINMQKIGLLVGLVLVMFACNSRNNGQSSANVGSSDSAYMYFKEEEYDAGKVVQGEKVTHTFVVENRGKKDLQIIDIQTTCGCTVPKYSKSPIASGKSANIDVVFDSSGKSGMQNKGITVVSNAAPSAKTLKIRCEVIEPIKK